LEQSSPQSEDLQKLINSKIEISDTLIRCEEICFYYYKFQRLYLEEPAWVDGFMVHFPYDYTRPYGWYDSPNYISMGEAVAAMINLKVIRNEEETGYNLKTLDLFQKQYPTYFTKLETLDHLLIPYEFYVECWNQLQSPETIKPYSVEICFYYMRQRGLTSSCLFRTKAKNHPALSDNAERRSFYWVPNLKFCDLYDLNRIIAVWELYSSYFAKFSSLEKKIALFEKHFEDYYIINRLKNDEEVPNSMSLYSDFEWWGITPKNENVSYRQGMSHFFSFFDEFTNLVSYGIFLDSQIKACHYQWQQASNFAKDPDSSLYQLQKPLLLALIEELFKTAKGINKFKMDEAVFATRIRESPHTTIELTVALLANNFIISPKVHQLKQILSPELGSTADFFAASDTLQQQLFTNLKETDITLLVKNLTFNESIKYAIWNMACILPHRRPIEYVHYLTNNTSDKLLLEKWLRLPANLDNPDDVIIQNLLKQDQKIPTREEDIPYAL